MRVLAREHMKKVDRLTETHKRQLTITNKYTGQEFRLYSKAGDGWWVPRNWPEPALPDEAGWERVDFPCSIELRPKQVPLVERYLHSKHRQGIICAGTGVGKTVMALWIMARLKYRTLIVVPTDYLMRQWADRIREFIGNIPIGIIRSATFKIDAPVVIAMIHTLALSKRYDWEKIRTHFGFTIWDECHRVSTTEFHRAISYFWDRYRLGLSATPYRKDGMFDIFKYHVGPIVSASNLPDLIPKVLMVYYYNKQTSSAGCLKPDGSLNMGAMFNKIANCKARTIRVVQYAVKALKKGRRVLVLCDRLNHVNYIAELIRRHGYKVGILTGQRKTDLDAPIIIGTHGSAGLGMDLPELDTLILASPRADVAQPVGRILRQKAIYRQPIVVDIVDTASTPLTNWAKARLRFYRSLGAEIKNYYINEIGGFYD